MLLITRRRKIGTILGHTIYAVSKSEMIALPNSAVQSNLVYSKDENRSFVHSLHEKCAMYNLYLIEAVISLQKLLLYCN